MTAGYLRAASRYSFPTPPLTMPIRSGLALCALALTLAACDSSADEPELSANSFVLSLQGDGVPNGVVNRSQAYSGSFVNDVEGQSFAILLGADPETGSAADAAQPFLAFVRQGARPSAGSYALPSLFGTGAEFDEDAFVGFYVDPSQLMIPEDGADDPTFDLAGFYLTTGGTLTITESSATRLIGSFSGTARPFSFQTGQASGASIRFEGRFHAVPSDDFDGGLVSGTTPFDDDEF